MLTFAAPVSLKTTSLIFKLTLKKEVSASALFCVTIGYIKFHTTTITAKTIKIASTAISIFPWDFLVIFFLILLYLKQQFFSFSCINLFSLNWLYLFFFL